MKKYSELSRNFLQQLCHIENYSFVKHIDPDSDNNANKNETVTIN